MYWVSYFICKGEKLDYLLNLNESDKIFYKESMAREQDEYADFEIQKLQALQSMFKM